MKTLTILVLCAMVALACAETNTLVGAKKFMRSSKTFVSSNGMHRFCIPIGQASVGSAQTLSLHVPRRTEGFSVKLDTTPAVTFSSPVSSEDKQCKRVSTLSLVKDFRQTQNFNYLTSEVRKSGTISGWIVGEKPEWISVRLTAFGSMQEFTDAEATCKSVLGVKSEAADWEKNGKHGNDEEHKPRTNSTMHRVFVGVRTTLFFLAIAAAASIVFILIRAVVRRCTRKNETVVAQDQIELGAVEPHTAAEEDRDLALAIERSLEDEKRVVEVPQTAAPQFVFLPPQMMPAVVPGGVATPYVPMFAPQFMNYSFDERRD